MCISHAKCEFTPHCAAHIRYFCRGRWNCVRLYDYYANNRKIDLLHVVADFEGPIFYPDACKLDFRIPERYCVKFSQKCIIWEYWMFYPYAAVRFPALLHIFIGCVMFPGVLQNDLSSTNRFRNYDALSQSEFLTVLEMRLRAKMKMHILIRLGSFKTKSIFAPRWNSPRGKLNVRCCFEMELQRWKFCFRRIGLRFTKFAHWAHFRTALKMRMRAAIAIHFHMGLGRFSPKCVFEPSWKRISAPSRKRIFAPKMKMVYKRFFDE